MRRRLGRLPDALDQDGGEFLRLLSAHNLAANAAHMMRTQRPSSRSIPHDSPSLVNQCKHKTKLIIST